MIEKIIIPEKLAYRVKCRRCGYLWDYKGHNPYLCSCPHCKTTILIGKEIAQLEQQKTSHVSEGGSNSI
jgi:hypothetical protein